MKLLLLPLLSLLFGCEDPEPDQTTLTNETNENRMLLVMSAPSVNDTYYRDAFNLIVQFQINYAKAIMGNDNVVIITDSQTKRFYEDELPADVLIEAEVYDIWMRDFSTVNPINPQRFRYTWASMTRQESIEVQNSFTAFAQSNSIQMDANQYLIDGGNLVDNYAGAAVTTTRFLEDNNLTYEQGVQVLKDILGLTQVAILPPDEEVLAHSDGMVSWLDANTLLVNDYSADADFKTQVMNELTGAFPSANIVEVPVAYTQNPPGIWEGFESACGVNLNATVTFQNIYVPTFNMPHETEALSIIRSNTAKNVIEVDAQGVCAMGGSVRCLTWQLAGENATRLIEAARNN